MLTAYQQGYKDGKDSLDPQYSEYSGEERQEYMRGFDDGSAYVQDILNAREETGKWLPL